MLLISDLHQHNVYYFVMQQKSKSTSDTISIAVVAKHCPHNKKTAVGQKEIRITRVMTFKSPSKYIMNQMIFNQQSYHRVQNYESLRSFTSDFRLSHWVLAVPTDLLIFM